VYVARPTSSFGYYRGSPIVGNDGGSQGVEVAGVNVFSAGQGSVSDVSGNGWTPTILYLFVLIIAEMFIFGILARRV
jgi:hypothetical protein